MSKQHPPIFNKPLPTTNTVANQVLYNPVKTHKIVSNLNSSTGTHPFPEYRTTNSAPMYTPPNNEGAYGGNSFFHQTSRKN
jgi:hypothetical protein